MLNAGAAFTERFSDFGKFREQFNTFDEFRKPFESKDIGLQRAVAKGVREFVRDFNFENTNLDADQKIQIVFELIDAAGISKSELASTRRIRQDADTGSAFISLVNRWAKNSSKMARPPKDDTEALIVFFYFTHFVTDAEGHSRDRYWFVILSNLEPEGKNEAERAIHFSTGQADNSNNSIGAKPEAGTADQQPTNFERYRQRTQGSIETKKEDNFDFVQISDTSPTEILLKILDRLISDSELQAFIYKLDWSEQEGAFRFNPDTFHNSVEEGHLDRLLFYLSLAGGVLRRGEVGIRDAILLGSWVKIIMGNTQVHAYLQWLHSDDQIPDHTGFLDAIYLFEQLTKEEVSILTNYRKIAESALRRLGR